MLQSGSLQTTMTDSGLPGFLDGQVTGMDVLDPTEGNEKTSLLEDDDEFDVQLTWQLTGSSTPVVGGKWIVALYSDDIDGVGPMTGLIAGPAIIPIVGGVSPLTFQHTFRVPSAYAQGGHLPADRDHLPLADRRPEQALGDVRVRGVHSDQHPARGGGDQLTAAAGVFTPAVTRPGGPPAISGSRPPLNPAGQRPASGGVPGNSAIDAV